MFLQMVWIPKYILFAFFGDDPKQSPFVSYLKRIHVCLKQLYQISSKNVWLNMYPNNCYFDDTAFQQYNSIEWKISERPTTTPGSKHRVFRSPSRSVGSRSGRSAVDNTEAAASDDDNNDNFFPASDDDDDK